MVALLLERGHDLWRSRRIAKGDSHVAQKGGMPDAADRAPFRPCQKFGLTPAEQRRKLRCVEPMPGREVRFRCWLRILVPGTEELAVIAAVDAISHRLAEFDRDRVFQLDGEIRDAAPRIKFVRADDGLRRTDVDARRAGSAMGGNRCVDGQFQVRKDLAQEEPGA